MAECLLVSETSLHGSSDEQLVSPKENSLDTTTVSDQFDNSGESCELPDELVIPESEDGSYTPPGPDPTLLKALQLVAPADKDRYCRDVWDAQRGFTDVMPYNVNGECGNWQQKYTALHQRRLQQLELIRANKLADLEEEPRFISYYCKEVAVNGNRGCGGLADRMSGNVYKTRGGGGDSKLISLTRLQV